ncbi:FHA domain-containing protein [Armatimonas sp.]|uniref:FHA domain-containing protein n=1 Tax=Armatimonas sp. TaxID=1872638 RepID=UPI003752E08E
MKTQLTALAFLLAIGARAQTPTPAPKLEPPKTTLAATPAPQTATPTPDPKAATPNPKAATPAPATPLASVATAAPVVVVLREKEPEQNNGSSLIAGWLGLAILVGGGFFGWRALKSKGLTVTGAFKQLGVELPQEASPAAAPVGKPAVAPLPPLPSLSDLPSAGAAAPSAPMNGGTRSVAPPLPAPTGQPKLVGISGPAAGKVIPLMDALSVGREPDNAFALPTDSTVSRKHALFLPTGTGWELADSGSANGTFLNGQRLSATQTLSHGDEIKIGSSRLRFEA